MRISQDLNITSFEENGILSESDYNKLTRRLEKVFDGLRVNAVRKFLKFTPLSFSDYLKVANKENPLFGDDFSLLIGDIIFEYDFNSSFFPQLEQETTVLSQPIIGENHNSFDSPFDIDHPFSNWAKLEVFAWPSVGLYHHQLDEAIAKSTKQVQPFDKSSVVEHSIVSLWKPWQTAGFHDIKTMVNFAVLV